MAEFRINVVVDPAGARRGSRQVERDLNRVGNAADRMRGLIQQAFLFTGITVGVRGLIELADTYTNLQNRLRTVTDGTAELAAVTERLFVISQSTRSSYEATAELYARVGLATRELGISQQQTLEFTESLNQAVILSGASAQEAQAGLIQLSQGLASGTLRGDELRSVLEQLPVVADVIAESLGVTRGELRELGSEGKIAADDVIRAFAEAREELQERFAEAVPTIGQAFTVLRNGILQLFGTIEGAAAPIAIVIRDIGLAISVIAGADLNGAFPPEFVDRIERLAVLMETLGRVAGAAAIIIGVNLAQRALGAATRAMIAFTVAIAANPLGALLTLITASISLLIAFSDQIFIAQGSMANLQDFAIAVWEAITAAFAAAIQFFQNNFGPVIEFLKSGFGELEFTFKGVLTVWAQVVDAMVGLAVGTAAAIGAAFVNIPQILLGIFASAFNAISLLFAGFINSIIRGINLVADFAGLGQIAEFEAFTLDAAGRFEDAGQDIAGSFAKGFEMGSGNVEGVVNGLFDRAEEIAQAREDELEASLGGNTEVDLGLGGGANIPPAPGGAGSGGGSGRNQTSFQDIINEYRQEAELLQLTNREREIAQGLLDAESELKRNLTASEREYLTAVLENNQLLEVQSQILDDLRGNEEEVALQQTALNDLFAQGKISIDEYTEAMRSLNVQATALENTISGGLQNGLARVAEQANNLGSQMSDFVVGAFNSATDAIVNFAKTGEFNVRQFFQDLFAQLLKLATNQLFAQLLGSFGGGGLGLGGVPGLGGGGGGFGLGALFGFQNGGEFQVGGSGGTDSQLVAFRATPGERVRVDTPAQQRNDGQAAAPAPIVNVEIQNVSSPKGLIDVLGTDSGKRSILNIIEENPSAVKKLLNR